jgi:homogentisate 1,2-dioxygenase
MRAVDTPLPASLVKEDGLIYQTGFGNSFETEAIEGALPRGRNNPREVPYNLYTEQLSGTAFTSPRHTNRRTWLYRIQPGVVGSSNDFALCYTNSSFGAAPQQEDLQPDPNPMRWKPMPFCDQHTTTFISGLKTLMSSGSPATKFGLAIYMYSFDQDMVDEHMLNSDGDFLIVPQSGSLRIVTELGKLIVHPKEICVIPRGIVFSVHKLSADDPPTRGYVLEVFGGHFQLPELGPIGSNGLANARDFLHPTAWCISSQVDYQNRCTIYNKFGGSLFERESPHSPCNVVAWHGNYAPFKYNLNRFCAVNSVTYDHLDPSIYTVLTCPGPANGEALADFVIFPHRIMATDSDTFRPPWFHRNTMTEFMGLIQGGYDAKKGFEAGGASLHSCMTPHGPDTVSYEKAVADPCDIPTKFDGGLAFMFETTCILELTKYARTCEHRDIEYAQCWSGLKDTFTGWDLLQPDCGDQADE